MTEATISREMALRIGLAARALPDCTPARMVDALGGLVGLPPQEKAIAKLRVKDLKAAFEEEADNITKADFEAALKCLKGGEESAVLLPELDAYTEGEMPDSIRVACASNEGELLNGHFGSCARFLVYQVAASGVKLVDIRATDSLGGDEEDKNKARAELIKDSQLMFVMSIGGPAVAKVVRRDIHPIKVPGGGNARAKMEELANALKGSPPPWLAKAMGHAPEDRIRFDREGDLMAAGEEA